MRDNMYKIFLNFKVVTLTPIACLWTLKCHIKLFSQGQSYSENKVPHFWTPDIKGFSKQDRSLSRLRCNGHHVFGIEVE